tara:strand:+ start:700 stop:912 length:213 start_codon:yes stop_codon:yes gene_type:complete
MSNYGYMKENGITPIDNRWTFGREITLNDGSIVTGYEGAQSTSNDNVEIIGDAKAFSNWMKENTPQEKDI